MPTDPLELPGPVLDAAVARLAGAHDAARDAIVSELVAAHPGYAAALCELSRALAGTERLLDRSFGAFAPADPDWIGAYRVVRRLGEGAFGVVYLCAQETPVRRNVAVKVLRPGAGDRGTLARFAAERQVLVGLDHPGIAGLIDAGELPDGRPYFTMEHVDGVPITEYCDRNRLPVEARLRLCAELIDAVGHAHAREVVHRDLKPANVLVVDRDGAPRPKIIDFGIAKALNQPASSAPATATGRVVGTPGYMSPEQAAGNAAEVDARADVFSLGVLLYELLAGDLPWCKRGPTEDSDPPPPSTRVQADPARTTTVASARSTQPRALVSTLRGELDWIVLRALQHRRELRYQSAAELADDLRRHLRGEPVRAGPPSLRYRVGKALRRHRTVVAAAGAIAVLGAAGAVASGVLHGAAMASEASRLGEAESAVRRLIERAFDPRLQQAAVGDELQRDLLRDALSLHERTLHERSRNPRHRLLRAQVLSRLADFHFYLAQYRHGLEAATEAEREAADLLAAEPQDALQRATHAAAQRNLGRCHFMLGNVPEAGEWSGRAVATLAELHRADSAHAKLFADALVEHASALHRAGDLDGELAAQGRAIEVLQEHLRAQPGHAESQRNLVRFQCGLGGMLLERGRAPEAEAIILAAKERAAAPAITDDERALVSRRLGLFYAATARPAEAAAELEQAAALTAAELQQHPARQQLHSRQRELRTVLCEQLHRLGGREAASREAALAIAEAEALAPDYPAWQTMLADTLARVAKAALTSGTDEAAGQAEAWLERALELTSAVPEGDRFGSEVRAAALAARELARQARRDRRRGPSRQRPSPWRMSPRLTSRSRDGAARG